ncbi:MAG: hypothetical protein JO222_11840 [Frankiales bacterium]|nr:hypothetical protein [Frankiales bacterium]
MTARRWLLAAVAALAAVWVVGPATAPIYDGIGSPDQPYRYVKAPPGYKGDGKKPTTATQVIPVVNGKNRAGYLNSGEYGPQVDVYVQPGSLGVPPGATSVTLKATPLAPSAPLPKVGTIVSNVYRITALAGTTPVPITGTGERGVYIQLRAPDARQPGPVFEHRTAAGWQREKTARSGNDIYQSPGIREFGDWALVKLPAAASAKRSAGGGVNVGLLAAGIGVLVLAGVILVIRLRRTRGVAL